MQELIFEEYCLDYATSILSEKGHHNVFVIGGHHFTRYDSGISGWYSFKKSGTNVEQGEIRQAAEQFNASNATAIFAIGGGSVIDLAKAVLYHRIQHGETIPFFLVAPTTSGSGSEATHFAVVYQGKKKLSLVHHALLPSLVLLDPTLTYSLPPYQSAAGGMDVLCQAVESYWSLAANEESKSFSKQAISLWKNNFLTAVNENSRAARASMMQAANFAGKAINITRTTGPHALSYYLTSYYQLPHGHAVALFLPMFFLYNDKGNSWASLIGEKNTSDAISFIQQRMDQSGLATTLSALNIDKELILEELLSQVNEERFSNNPVSFDRERLRSLIRQYL